jgi:tripartite-type tricarboxylate transporter receptor subunit TctC
MDHRKKRFLMHFAALLIIFVFTGWFTQAHCQDKYPAKAIDLIVPVTPGGAADLYARLVAEGVKKRWGVPVNVINKPGGNTVPANLELYQAKPDGYTVLADSHSGVCLLEIGMKDLPFKVLDRTYIAVLATSPHVYYVPASSAMKNLKDVEAEVKKDPEHFTWGSFGGASPGDFSVRQFFKASGIDVSKTKPVSARGGSEVLTMTAGGHIKLGPGAPGSGLPHVRAGTVRVVGVSGSRAPDFPDVPTAVEQGYPTVKGAYYLGISGPPNLPASVGAKWDEALRELVNDPAFISKLKTIGLAPHYLNSREAKEAAREYTVEARALWGLK